MKLKLLFITIALFVVCRTSYGQTYNLITSTSELTNGDYLIVADGSTNDGIMLNTISATPYINYTTVTNPGASITTGFTSANVFTINVSGGNITIFNSNLGYVSWGRTGNTGNTATFFNGIVATTEQWTPTVASGLWTLANVNTATRLLQWNNASPRFAAYTSAQVKLKFYKLAASTPTITTTPTSLTGFTYITGSGPSTEQSFTASGSNLTANILLTAPTNYEISTTSGSGFGGSITLTQSGGNVSATTIYVRLKAGLSIGNYNTVNVDVTSSGATTKNVACSGSVTANLESDIITANGESATVSSLENDTTITTTADGAQVWKFTIRDGGSDGVDADTLPTIVNSIVFSQNVGNAIDDWSDAIQAVALFNGTTKIANGVVTSNQITFSGSPIISVPDNSNVTLTVRLSVQTNPNNTGGNLDGDDFVFNISNANVSTSATGSGFSAFAVANSINDQNVLSVLATKLVFTQQPVSSGIGSPMADIIVSATDANGNVDLGFTGIVSLTSTGTMTGSPLTATAVAGVATFNSILHTVVGSGLTLAASSTGLTLATSNGFNIVTATTLLPGDLAILAVNTSAASGSSEDEISFVCFVDVTPGTQFYLTDNGYERVTSGKWGNTEGIISLTRTNTTLPKGSIITIHSSDNGINEVADFTVKVCGVVDSNWTKGVISGSGFTFDLNKDDQVWIMQGGAWSNVGTGNHDATYSGNVLYGWTDIAWKTAPAWDTANGTKGSTIYPKRECYTTDVSNPETGAAYVKFDDPVNPDFSTTTNGKLDWIALINNPSNWDSYSSDSNYDSGGFNYSGSTTCPTMVVASNTYVNGKWTGKKDTNWFNCGNWDTLVVPDETVDVQVGDNTFNREAIVDYNASFASYYGGIAKCKNLTISGEKVTLEADVNDKLEVHGNLILTNPGVLDMSDGNNGTPDGQLYLYGNWTNYKETEFKQGESTVHFVGTSPQTVFCTDKTEIFFNVNLANANNPFTTNSFSSDLIAEGSLTLSNGSDLTIKSGHYALATKNLSVGTGSELIIEHTGSLVQTDDSGTVSNSGTIKVNKTTTPFEKYDYTYWSSPIVTPTIASTFPTWRTDYAFYFDPTKFEDLHTIVGGITTISGTPDGFDDNEDDWVNATTMSPGKGYIIMGPTSGTFPMTQSVTFTGTVNNGVKTTAVSLTPGIPTDDDWNLVGNPYPSAISADAFINANIIGTGSINQTINGTLYFWTHKADIGAGANLGPDALNFSSDDYAVYTLAGGTGTSGSISGGSKPLGYIASGQAFFVEAQAAGNVAFNNSMRATSHSNSQFYKTKSAKSKAVSKNRLWLNLENSLGMFSQQLVGYFDNATLGYDNGYDGLLNDAGNYINFYSFIDSDTYKIQARPAFDENDQVKLGYSSAIAGTFSIDIDSKEGIFTYTDTNVYLEDKLLETIHDLKNPYTFNTEAGTFNDRFVLRYTNKTLGTKDYESLENQVVISNKNKQIKVYSKAETIDNVVVYDLLGRKLFQKDKVDSSEIIISNLISSQQVLLVKVILKKGNEVTKKVVF